VVVVVVVVVVVDAVQWNTLGAAGSVP